MKSLAIKGTIGLLSVGGLGAGGYYGFKSINNVEKAKITTKDELTKEKYTPLVRGSNQIATVLKNYKSITETKGNLKFTGFNGDKVGDEKAEDILLRHCDGILEKAIVSQEDYTKAKRWCVEPITVAKLIEKEAIVALNTENDDDKAKWKEKIKSYRTSNEPKINSLTFNGVADPSDDEVRNIKSKCSEISKKQNHEDEFEENLGLFRRWCSNN